MGERNVTCSVEVVGSTPTASTNLGNYTMKLPCSQCNKTFSMDDVIEIVYCDDGIHFLCSRDCQDEWDYPIAAENDFDKQRPSLI